MKKIICFTRLGLDGRLTACYMDGIEATKAIRSMADPLLSYLPVVAMTANAFEEDRQRLISAGTNGHLGKPMDIDKLFATLPNILLYKNVEGGPPAK